MSSALDKYVFAAPTEQENDSVGDKLLREGQLLGGGIVYGAADSARDAVDNPWWTAAKLGAGVGIGFTVGMLTRRANFLLPVIGSTMGAAFLKDVVPRAGNLGHAMANSWDSAESFDKDQMVAREALGSFIFDGALMTAGGIAGGALSNVPGNYYERRLLANLHAHDPEMGFHSERVGKLSELLAKEVGLSSTEIAQAQHAGLGHDFGKVKIPVEILRGTAHDLTPDQRLIINTHPVHSRTLLETVPFRRAFQDVPEIASFHHEHLNGTGYPYKVGADQLSPAARVVAVADKFDAMLGPRTYQAGHSPQEIFAALQREAAANHVDQTVVDALFRLPAKDVYSIAQIGHEPISKSYFSGMKGRTMADLAAGNGEVPRLVPSWITPELQR